MYRNYYGSVSVSFHVCRPEQAVRLPYFQISVGAITACSLLGGRNSMVIASGRAVVGCSADPSRHAPVRQPSFPYIIDGIYGLPVIYAPFLRASALQLRWLDRIYELEGTCNIQ